MKKLLIYVLIPLLLIGVSVWLGFQIPIVTSLGYSEFLGLEMEETGVYAGYFDEDEQCMTIDSHPFESGMSAVKMSYTVPNDVTASITFLNGDGEPIITKEVVFLANALQVQIPIEKETQTFSMVFPNDAIRFVRAVLLLNGVLNVRAMVWMLLLLFSLYLLAVFYKKVAVKPEYGFLLAAIAIMLIQFIWLPLNMGAVWDDVIHRSKAEGLAYFMVDRTLPESIQAVAITSPGYIPGAMGMRLAMLFTEEEAGIMLVGRIFSALAYIAVCFLAVKVIPRYKIILSVVALIPTSLFLASSFSYDLMVSGCMYLCFALMVREFLTPKQLLTPLNALWIMLSALFSCLPKAVYIPILLFMLFLPNSKFASRKQRIAFRVAVIVLVLAVAATFVLPTLIDSGSMGDERGGDVDPAAQMALIFGDPFGYVGMLISNIISRIPYMLINMGSNFAYLGEGSGWYKVSLLVFLLFVTLTDVRRKEDETLEKINLWRKGCLAVLIIGAIALIYTAMFIAFTPVGQTRISGVQARYYLPLLPLVMALIQPNALKFFKKDSAYNSLVLITAVMFNFVIVGQLFIFSQWY